MTAGPGLGTYHRYPASIEWSGRDDIDVSIVFRSAAALGTVLRRLADEARGLGIALQGTLVDGEGIELRIGVYPAKDRGCLGITAHEAFDAAGDLLANATLWTLPAWLRPGERWPAGPVVYPTLWASSVPGEEGAIDFYLCPVDCPTRRSLELCPRLDDVFRLVAEYMETGYLPRGVEWVRETPGPKMNVAVRG